MESITISVTGHCTLTEPVSVSMVRSHSPASREHVLGDLHEKCKSPRQYLIDATSVLGPVIISRIRRTTDVQVFFMEVIAVYLSFSAAAWWLDQKGLLFDHAGFACFAMPTTVTAIGLLMCNAYADPEKEVSVRRSMLQSVGCLALAFFGQAVIFDACRSFSVPFGVMLYGSCVSVVLICTLRMLFPPVLSSRSKGALLKPTSNKPDLIAIRVPFQQIRQAACEIHSSRRWKFVSTYVAVLVIAELLLSAVWPGAGIKPHMAVLAIVLLLAVHHIGRRG